MTTVTVSASRTYDVLIGRGLLDRAGEAIAKAAPARRVMLVTDDTVYALYAARAERSLRASGMDVEEFVFPHGEQSKTLETYARLQNALCAMDFTRDDLIVALGGGVVGDLAGFAAATYRRGIRYVQLPTTVLSAVDSSVGGKTAVDLPAGKNQVGAFYQPELVLCDCACLDSLPQDIFAGGCAEVIKYGVIRDASLFEDLYTPFRGDEEAIIARCVEIKRDVVSRDEFDRGERAILNFGHTIGHAVELCSGYRLSHGQSVAIGMAMIARAAARRGLCDASVPERIVSLLNLYGLPTGTQLEPAALLRAMLGDKKRGGDSVSLILPRRIGQVEICPVPVSDLPGWLEDAGENTR